MNEREHAATGMCGYGVGKGAAQVTAAIDTALAVRRVSILILIYIAATMKAWRRSWCR
jgi:hypothetical protein